MNRISTKKSNLILGLALGLLLLAQMGCLFYYGARKAGFHEDELYTYYSTNKTAGLFVNDRQWVRSEEIRNELVVLPEEGFRYQVVKQMQSWDVHPPIYYYIVHTVCSLMPGVFSKWQGIGINMAAFVLCFFLLAYGVYEAVTFRGEPGEETKGKILAVLTVFAWGFSGAVISGVMFIRMYQWLTLFILLCMVLHLRALKRQEFKVSSFFLPLGITVFLGFLTQYYYLIFHFFLGAGFSFLLLKNKRLKELAAYVCTCGLSLGLAICYYPASLSHIFRGYRGREAVSEFGNASNTMERLRFFYDLFDSYVMNGTLSWWILIICLLAVTAGYLNKRKKEKKKPFNESVGLLLFTCAGYFFTISKTALILGETSNRYQLPVYGIILFLLLYGVWTSVQNLFSPGKADAKRIGGMMAAVLSLVILLTDGTALKNGKVFFLYEEEKEIMAYIKEHKEQPVVVFYNEASPDHIWWLCDELIEYEKVYLASQGNTALLTDKEIRESGRLLVYVADHENGKECLNGLLMANKNLSSYHQVAKKGLWTLYEAE